jgi:hypothetical protein
MAVSEKTSGSQTAVISTEHTLATVTDPGIYQLVVDIANLVNNDRLELRIYGKARSADTERLEQFATVLHAQTILLVRMLPVISPHHAKFTLTQTTGTGRVFPWSIYSTGA